MALTDETGGGMVMPVTPMYGNGGMGNSGFGGEGWWVLLLFLLLLGNNGWGNNGGGGFGGYGGGVGGLYPWMNQANQISDGFRDQMLNTSISDIQNSINSNQIADLQQSFATQTAMLQGFNQIGSQFADCCCENRLGTADLKYTIATENCADRAAISDGIRDVMENCNRNNQAILDKLCQLELDGKNDRIADLERQLTMANLTASQTAQTAAIRAGQVAEIDAMYNRLRDCPVPCQPVYGSQPIFTCNNGCGGNNF